MNEPKLIRRTSITNAAIMKQKRYLVIAILCVVTLILGSSYALLTNFDQTEEVITFKTGNLNITVNNALVTLNGNLPENDTTGLQNATPVTLTLTNTGTMFIEEYDVKLVSDLNKNSTLKEDYIKYAISEDGISYSKPKILTSDENIIFSGYELEIDESKTIYLKVWIDEASGNQSLGKEYYGSIKVDLYQKKERPLLLNEFKKELLTRTNSYILEDDTYYVSGDADDNDTSTTDDIDFNYVWYSGKLWRITAINPDGSMKMITEDLMTSIGWGEDYNFYTDESTSSWIYQWLNEDFLDTLYNYENIIVTDYKWNVTSGDGTVSTKLAETTMVPAKVGLLNSYEYYKSYEKVNGEYPFVDGYLNMGYYWWLSNRYSSSSSNVWFVNLYGYADSGKPYNAVNVTRPSINLKSTLELNGGTGTKTDPYILNLDKEGAVANTTLLNTRISGEYVKLENDESSRLFRIVDKELVGESLTTKVVLNDYVKESDTVLTKYFSGSSSHELWSEVSATDTTYWRGYLNTTWLGTLDTSMLEKGTYYLGSNPLSTSYKSTVCSTISSNVSIRECIENGTIVSNTSSDDYVGLLRVGEMFASQTGDYTYNNASRMWLITPFNSSHVLADDGSGILDGYIPYSYSGGARPSINLKSAILVKSGTGTKQDPFVVGLPDGYVEEEPGEGQ